VGRAPRWFSHGGVPCTRARARMGSGASCSPASPTRRSQGSCYCLSGHCCCRTLISCQIIFYQLGLIFVSYLLSILVRLFMFQYHLCFRIPISKKCMSCLIHFFPHNLELEHVFRLIIHFLIDHMYSDLGSALSTTENAR
jgi:hypothetical protein